jgi:hypothetical protein
MQKVAQTGVGVQNLTFPHTDAIAVQVDGDGVTTFQVNARVSPEAPWMPVIASATADVIQSLPYYPELQLDVTAGTGTVTLYATYGV